MFRRGLWIKTVLLVTVEAGIVLTVVLFGLYLRFPQRYSQVLFGQRGIYKVVFTTIICQLIFYLFDLYDISKPRLRRELLTNLFQAAGVATLALGMVVLMRPSWIIFSGGAKRAAVWNVVLGMAGKLHSFFKKQIVVNVRTHI